MSRFRLFGRSSARPDEQYDEQYDERYAARHDARRDERHDAHGRRRPAQSRPRARFGFGRDLDPATDHHGFAPAMPEFLDAPIANGRPVSGPHSLGRPLPMPARPGTGPVGTATSLRLPQAVAAPAAPRAGGPVAHHNGAPHRNGIPAARPAGHAVRPGPAGSDETRLPDPAEAGALAGAFAADYMSWDEDDPARRGRVLSDYLRTPVEDPTLLGWSGTGRQRADFALPGLVRPDGDGRVLVDVRVRVTPYRAVGDHAAEPAADHDPGLAGVPAVAPAPTARGWRSLASYWVRLSVPVALEGGRLVVDAWEEALDLDAPTVRASAPEATDHALDGDDPLAVRPLAGGVA